jgi:hypothetical protein
MGVDVGKCAVKIKKRQKTVKSFKIKFKWDSSVNTS